MNQELDLKTPLPPGDHALLEKYEDIGQAAGESITKTYRSSSGETDQGKTLPNLLAVTTFLKDRGWKCGKSKIYQDVKHIRQNKDGSYSEAAVLRYAERHLRLRGSAAETKERKTSSEFDKVQEEKIIQEARKLKAQADLAEIKAKVLMGELAPKDFFIREIDSRATILRADYDNWARGQATGITALVKGDPDLIPDLVVYLLRIGDGWFARYAEDREFTVTKSDIAMLSGVNNEDEREDEVNNDR